MSREKSDNYTVTQAARRLGVSLKWIRDLIYAGRLQAKKVAGSWRIDKQDVEARLDKRGIDV